MWNPRQYLKFESERTQPCRDLVNRVQVADPHRIADLGCGPGNSTRMLRERWPAAEVVGIDSSAEMIEKARQAEPSLSWIVADIRDWIETPDRFDVIFANATFQWLPGHDVLLPRLLTQASAALAFQMPDQTTAPGHQLMRELALSSKWRQAIPALPRWHGRDVSFYYDLLSPLARHLDLWETEYVHILPDAEAVAEWYKGTGLRPYLDALKTPEDRDSFVGDFISGIRKIYNPQPDGRLLFPFRRIFVVAHK